jgi:Cu(I)/Ag(I) efflux system protein CusF
MKNLLTVLLATPPAFSDEKQHQGASALTEGEVRKADKDAKKLTIKHGPIRNIDTPAMTMVFQVKDPKLLEQLKPGNRIMFSAEKLDGIYTVSTIAQRK